MKAEDEYFGYLKGRSWTGLLYRRYWLYPTLTRYLTGKVLDVGCGIGDYLRFRPGTMGVDINPAAVDWCQSQGLNVQLMQPDRLPFPNLNFEGVVLDNVLEHISTPEPLLAEVSRVLAPGGCLVVGVPGRKGYASDPDHKVYYDKERLTRVLRENNFEPQRLFHMPINADFLETRMRQYCLYGVFSRA